MLNKSIAFIGAGNMSRSIISGLIKQGYDPKKITATNPSSPKLEALESDFSINTSHSNTDACNNANVIVLAVKPQIMQTACDALINDKVDLKGKLILSVAVGITIDRIKSLLNVEDKIVRTMPNTPSLLGKGVCGLFAYKITDDEKAFVDQMIGSTGLNCWVENELQIDSISAVSGSGPAYFFLFMEAMVEQAKAFGFDENTAREIVQQTCAGAAEMVKESDVSIEQLRKNVTSKGGSTAAALNIMQQENIPETIKNAMKGAYNRTQEMAKSF